MPITAGVLTLIGNGHQQQPVNYVKTQADEEHGTLTVTKAGAFAKRLSRSPAYQPSRRWSKQ
jgi:hypothetical protein